MPTISVIIPAYNRERYLEESVRSVLTQTFKDIEVLIINDTSTDTTSAIAERLALEDARVKVFHHKENSYRSSALNTGLTHATGIYISFLDSDDYYLTDKLERQSIFLQSHPLIDGVYGDFEILNEPTEPTIFTLGMTSTEKVRERLLEKSGGVISGAVEDILEREFIPSCSPLIKSSVFNTIRFDTTLRNMEDFDMWLQILGAGFTLTKLAGSTYVYRRHGEQKSSNIQRMNIARTIIENKMQNGTYVK